MVSNDYKARRLLLRQFPAEEVARRYAEENGWPITGQTEEDPDEGTVREIMWMVEPSLVLHYAEDRMSETSYVMASSWSPDRADDFSARLEREMDVRRLGELLRDCDEASTPQEKSVAIARLALGAPRLYDVDVFTRVGRGLSDPDGDVRLASIWAIGFMPWPEYRPVIQKIAETDTDQIVRETARDLVEAYEMEDEAP